MTLRFVPPLMVRMLVLASAVASALPILEAAMINQDFYAGLIADMSLAVVLLTIGLLIVMEAMDLLQQEVES